jgi:hypothetical protein
MPTTNKSHFEALECPKLGAIQTDLKPFNKSNPECGTGWCAAIIPPPGTTPISKADEVTTLPEKNQC